MTVDRGAALTTSTTFGYADDSDVGPTAGNGFDEHGSDDLTLLHDVGVVDVRLTLDWSRLQPRPGALDDDWTERFADLFEAAEASGLRVWATLYDGSVPRWFDDEGGLGDIESFVRWWPRWVERAAETFGDHVHAWLPFDVVPDDAVQPWRDTWGILGGTQPVVASVAGIDQLDRIAVFVDRMDRLGVALAPAWDPDDAIGDRTFDETADRWGNILRSAADRTGGVALVVPGFVTGHDDPDMGARIVEVVLSTVDDASDDGTDVEVVFVEPAITGHDSPPGLLAADRSPTPAGEVFFPGTATTPRPPS